MPSVSNSASRRQSGSLELKRKSLVKNATPAVEPMDTDRPVAVPAQTAHVPNGLTLELLPDGPYLAIAEFLDTVSMSMMDATCKTYRQMNRAFGPWRNMGNKQFQGLEIDGEIFDDTLNMQATGSNQDPHKKRLSVDWKTRYVHFHRELPKFRAPFNGSILTDVKNSDEVSYCNCRFRTDLLGDAGVYLEVQVYQNADNLSLAVVDFDEGGKSSVTFSPDTGAVIKETKIQETPRKVKGWYIQPLRHIPPKAGHGMVRNERFEGIMGLYIKNGKIAFFRKFAHGDQQWECTGFVIDLDWVHGRKITPCLAFRDEGPYHVCVNKISQDPPVPIVQDCANAWDIKNWQELNWEGGNHVAYDE